MSILGGHHRKRLLDSIGNNEKDKVYEYETVEYFNEDDLDNFKAARASQNKELKKEAKLKDLVSKSTKVILEVTMGNLIELAVETVKLDKDVDISGCVGFEFIDNSDNPGLIFELIRDKVDKGDLGKLEDYSDNQKFTDDVLASFFSQLDPLYENILVESTAYHINPMDPCKITIYKK